MIKDLGDVESVATEYIEVKEGMVSKKHYYIPKYHIQGFDGDNLYTSLTKDEIKDRFERDSPPSPSESQTPEYQEQVLQVESAHPQFVHGVPLMAKEPSTEISVDYSGTTYNIPWDQLIHKHARTTDSVEIGYVERIGNEFIVVREGISNVHIYYIPKTYIRDYDGSQLWIDAPSGLVRSKFERETEPPGEELRAMAIEAPRYKRGKPQRSPKEESDTITVETEIDLEQDSPEKDRAYLTCSTFMLLLLLTRNCQATLCASCNQDQLPLLAQNWREWSNSIRCISSWIII